MTAERALFTPRRRLVALATVVALFVVLRYLMVTTTGHLLFHLDSAEYGILRGIRLYLGQSTFDVLSDPETRLRFGLSCTLVADTGLHGTLVLAGLLTHWAVTALDAPIATVTLRMLAIGVSTAALVAWLRTLARAFPKSPVPLVFAVLVLAAPPMLMKLSVLFWGTHDLVLAIHAFVLLVFAGWIGSPARSLPAHAARAALVGAAGALCMAANTSLALPSAFLGLWLAGEATWAARATPRRAGLVALVMAVFGVGALVGTWMGLVNIEALEAIGLQEALFANDKLEQISGAASLHGPSWWWRLARPKTMELYPALFVSAWVLVRALRRARSGAPPEGPQDHPFVLFCAAHVVLGLVVIMALPFAYTGTPDLRFTPRYTAVLHPLGLVVVAAWLVGVAPVVGRVRVGAVLLATWVAVFLPGQLGMIDLANAGASSRYDGTLIYYAPLHGQEVGPPAARTKLGGASRSFLLGMGLLIKYQQFDYWDWRTPSEARSLEHPEMLARYMDLRRDLLRGPDFDRAEFFRGAGYASRIVFGLDGHGLLATTLVRFPEEAPWLEEGWAMSPEALAFRTPEGAWQGSDAVPRRFNERE